MVAISEELTRNEINRYIHTEIMGQCWHEFDDGMRDRRVIWIKRRKLKF